MKFLFGDRVKVVSGFYQGIEGVVTDYSDVEKKCYFEGCVESEMCAREIKTWINVFELVKVEE